MGISLVVVAATAVVVVSGLLLAGASVDVALLLGAIATSTAPAAVADVVHECDARGPFSRTLLGIVAVDDAWGIVVLSLALATVLGIHSPDAARVVLTEGLLDISGAILVGCALGVPIALVSGRIKEGEPTLAEALGGVVLCAGLALFFDVSLLLAAMTMGVVVANLARHHRRAFRAIEGIEWPFMILFFIMSGASLEPGALDQVGTIAAAYVLLRVLGRCIGGWAGARLVGRGDMARGLGIALLPQAGVAIGMALVVSDRLPELGPSVLGATVASTIVFELVGPILTRRALDRFGEIELPAIREDAGQQTAIDDMA